ncbi:hydroxyacid dehydrogenase [Candidatus Daviesbacteria bacterium]|nr:hydroxyacid dehydrogenase [Candidatus Daviesbacteria bacterium]
MKIGIFNIRGSEEEFFKNALAGNEVECFSTSLLAENLPQSKDFEVISVFTDSKVDFPVIDAFSNLKLIAARSTGTDHIDLKRASEKNITVSNVPVYGESTVAEFAFALLLAIAKKIVQADLSVKITEKFNREGLMGFDLIGKTFGVIGTGHIGTSAIKIAKGFNMEVIAFDAYPNQELAEKLQFSYVSLEQLLSRSDVISLHIPLLPETKHLINQKNIGFIKRGAVLINTSRGEIVESQALIQGLETGIISAAGLDVMENEITLRANTEPDPEEVKINDKLIEMSNVIVTPHNASNTKEAMDRIRQTTVDNIKAFINSNPQNVVKSPS